MTTTPPRPHLRRPLGARSRALLWAGIALAAVLGAVVPRARADEDPECDRLYKEGLRWLEKSEKSGSADDARRAGEALDEAERRCPDTAVYAFYGGLAHVFTRDVEGSRQRLSRVHALARRRAAELNHPEAEADLDPMYRFLRAAMNLYLADKAGPAVEDLRRIRNKDPRFLPGPLSVLLFRALVASANAHAAAEEWEPAIALTKEAVLEARYDPDDVRRDQARRNLGQIYRRASRWKESQEVWDDLVKRYPSDAVLRYGLASVLADQFLFDKAIEQWAVVVRLIDSGTVPPDDGRQVADARLRYGVCFHNSRRVPEARREIEAFLEKNPDSVAGNFQMGRLWWEQLDDAEKAAKYFEKARALDPLCEPTLKALLTIYTVGRPDAAKAKEIDDLLNDPTKTKQRTDEMDRRRRTMPESRDGGCT